jgi:hypothetical protein
MQFSFEVPTKHLDHFTGLQNFIFALSFKLEDPVYFKYVEKMYTKGVKVVIDNSVNELNTPTPINTLVEYSKMFPNASIVSPDWLDWGLMEQIGMAKNLADEIPKNQIITPINNVNWLDYYLNESFNNIAMGYNLRYLNDIDMARLKGTHFLGLNSVRELFVARPKSCDTGLPIKLAREYLTISDWVRLGCPHEQLEGDFFDWELSSKELFFAEQNMITLRTIGMVV